MNPREIKHISKTMSLVLRHRPELFQLKLDEQGWCSVDQLLAGFKAKGQDIDRAALEKVVAKNDKKRFAFSEDGQRIRANQGHSIPIQLGYEALQPPIVLYHGTATRFLKSIKKSGLIKGLRHHVHLSADKDTAVQVGQRHGKPIVLTVQANKMHQAGHSFFLSENGVWLTEQVPVEYLNFGS